MLKFDRKMHLRLYQNVAHFASTQNAITFLLQLFFHPDILKNQIIFPQYLNKNVHHHLKTAPILFLIFPENQYAMRLIHELCQKARDQSRAINLLLLMISTHTHAHAITTHYSSEMKDFPLLRQL